jgi:hypothetical protein
MISRDALTKAHAEHKISGAVYRGQILHGLTAETSDPGNTQGANAVDQSVAPRNLPVTIVSSSTNDRITTSSPHGLIAGDIVIISGHTGSTPSINGTQTVATVPSSTEFTVGIDITVGGTGGSFVKVTSSNAVCDLHVNALTLGGFTSVTVKVRHSADNSTYSDLVTFSSVTAVGSNRQTFSGVVQRYTAMSWDFIGAGSGQSITPYVSIARY